MKNTEIIRYSLSTITNTAKSSMARLKNPVPIIILSTGLLLSGVSQANESIRQSTDMIQFGTGAPQRGVAVLTRERDNLSLTVSTMDLNPNAAYSVWWVMFNKPENCLVPNGCGEPDVFEAPGDLNDAQIPAVQMSASYAAGFVTGNEGLATFTAELKDGSLPDGTFVDNGWSTPVGFGPDDNAGLTRGNGLDAEVHIVLRSHGDAVAGSVANQATTFDGLCDVQACSLVQVAIFRKPESRLSNQCVDTDGDGWGWDGFATCIP